MTKKLAGKVALVTGASKGIGASIARLLAQEGANVVVNYSSSKEGAEKVVKEIQKNGSKAVAVRANLSKPEEIPALFSETKKAFGKLDILINNAGVYDFSAIEEVTVEEYHRHFDLNVLGLLLATKEAVKMFGIQGGSIVNLSSIVSSAHIPGVAIYSGTKGAVDAITRSLASELGPRKIRINSVNPGIIATEGTHTKGILESDFKKEVEEKTPLGRIGAPEDVARAVLFLASDDSSWITGECLVIAGGWH